MNENQLVFLISQPRSGSSLTQQLLLNSKIIDSAPEPWQMLSLVHTFKQTTIQSGYNPNYTILNYLEYLESMEHGLSDLKKKIKAIALEQYGNKTTDNHRFLDKTPRYYHIIDELYELFPTAKFIFLVRNPLAVFASMLDYNFKGDFESLLGSKDRLDDLLRAPRLIQQGINQHASHFLLKYEDLVENPETEMSRLFNYLEIDAPEKTNSYQIDTSFLESDALDKKSLGANSTATSDYLQAWKKSLDSTQKQRLAQDYIHKLNTNFDNFFGYNLDEIENEIKAHKPAKNSIFNLGFDMFTKDEAHLSIKKVVLKRLFLKLQRN